MGPTPRHRTGVPPLDCPPSSYRITQASVHWTARLHEPKSRRRPAPGLPAFMVSHHTGVPPLDCPPSSYAITYGVPPLDCPPSSNQRTQASLDWTARLHRLASRRRPIIGLPAFIVSQHVGRPVNGLPVPVLSYHASVPASDCPPSSYQSRASPTGNTVRKKINLFFI